MRIAPADGGRVPGPAGACPGGPQPLGRVVRAFVLRWRAAGAAAFAEGRSLRAAALFFFVLGTVIVDS